MIRDCAAFEIALAEALACEGGADGAAVEALRAHAAGCDVCGRSSPLINLAILPAPDRDPLPEPTDLEWARFDRRLSSRLDAERSRGWGLAAAAIAATLAGAALGAWLLRAPEAPLVAQGPKPEAPKPIAPAPLPAPTPENAATPEEAELDPFPRDPWSARGLAEDDGPGLADGPIPDVEKLDREALERLERWLDEQEARLSPRGEA